MSTKEVWKSPKKKIQQKTKMINSLDFQLVLEQKAMIPTPPPLPRAPFISTYEQSFTSSAISSRHFLPWWRHFRPCQRRFRSTFSSTFRRPSRRTGRRVGSSARDTRCCRRSCPEPRAGGERRKFRSEMKKTKIWIGVQNRWIWIDEYIGNTSVKVSINKQC